MTDGRVIAGSTGVYIGTTTEGEIPNITASLVKGGQGEVVHSTVVANGAFYTQPVANSTSAYGGSGGNANLFFDASRISSLYVNDATQVRSASLYMHMCIKYI